MLCDYTAGFNKKYGVCIMNHPQVSITLLHKLKMYNFCKPNKFLKFPYYLNSMQ